MAAESLIETLRTLEREQELALEETRGAIAYLEQQQGRRVTPRNARASHSKPAETSKVVAQIGPKSKRRLSEEGRAAIGRAAKKRWAKYRRAQAARAK